MGKPAVSWSLSFTASSYAPVTGFFATYSLNKRSHSPAWSVTPRITTEPRAFTSSTTEAERASRSANCTSGMSLGQFNLWRCAKLTSVPWVSISAVTLSRRVSKRAQLALIDSSSSGEDTISRLNRANSCGKVVEPEKEAKTEPMSPSFFVRAPVVIGTVWVLMSLVEVGESGWWE